MEAPSVEEMVFFYDGMSCAVVELRLPRGYVETAKSVELLILTVQDCFP